MPREAFGTSRATSECRAPTDGKVERLALRGECLRVAANRSQREPFYLAGMRPRRLDRVLWNWISHAAQ